MSNSETKILRGEIDKLLTYIRRQDEIISEVRAQYAGLAAQLMTHCAGLAAENKALKTRITYYENPHSPPSHGSIPSRQRQKAKST